MLTAFVKRVFHTSTADTKRAIHGIRHFNIDKANATAQKWLTFFNTMAEIAIRILVIVQVGKTINSSNKTIPKINDGSTQKSQTTSGPKNKIDFSSLINDVLVFGIMYLIYRTMF